MILNIIQLSDIHFKSNETENPILKRQEKLFDAIKNNLIDGELTILMITGDIAYSGQKTEYNHALQFVDDLINKIKTYTKKDCVFITIPGNHDCELTKDSVRERIISSFETSGFSDLDEDIINLCCKPQINFNEWKKNVYGQYNLNVKTISNHNLIEILEVKIGDYNIIFNCFNTSWVSKLKEEYGKMVFPNDYFESNHFHNQSNLTFNLIHHPFNWQAQNNYRLLKKLLEDTGDVILSGHEHQQGMQINYNEDGNFTGYIEAGALQDSYSADNSCFNLLKFNLKTEAYNLMRYSLENEQYVKKNETNEVKFQHRFNLSKKQFILNQKFKDEILESGNPFVHSTYGEINFLNEIFVYPELRKISDNYTDNKIRFPEITNSADLHNEEKIRFIVIGDDISGKSALCKTFFNSYYEKDFVPILVSGEDLKETDKIKFRKTLKELFVSQYEKRLEPKFDTLSNDKIVLIIDDFHLCPINQKYRWRLIKNITEVYPNIIITGNTAIIFQPFVLKKEPSVNAFEDFTQFNLLEFNVELRYKLINKWNRLGREDVGSRNEVISLNEKADKHIKNLITNNLLPAFPLTILTLLQSLEAQGSGENIITNSYELLIGNSINKSVKNPDELDFYSQFLSHYCHFLFENHLKEITEVDFQKVFNNYLKLANIEMDFKEVLHTLLKSKLLKKRDAYLVLSNKYTYYYFVAKHISQNLADPTYRELVYKISKRVYRDEFYNIILFLTHFSKEPFITESIYNNANEIFKEEAIIKLDDDILLINSLIDTLPKLVVESINSENTDKERLKEKAEIEESEANLIAEKNTARYDINEDVNAIDLLSKFILAIKTFELLGKITQKNWGSPNQEEKMKYSKATFDLTLRALSFYFRILIENKEGLVEYLKLFAGKRKINELNDIKEITSKFLFTCSYFASFSLMRRCANSIGHIKLTKTFEDIIEKEPVVSYKLIDILIKLDCSDSIPFSGIEDIIATKGFNKNYLPKFLLQNFVYNHIRMYDTSIGEKQRVSELLDIEIKDQLVADISSREKK